MVDLDTGTRAYLIDKNSLTTDSAGREVLRGLTFEETQEYLSASCAGNRRIAQCNKHERERMKLLSALNGEPERGRNGASD